jgi:tetratricopeptide (TPR) repeat protein
MTTPLRITGRPDDHAALPAWLQPTTTRGDPSPRGRAEAELLPDGLLEPRFAIDTGPAARSAADGATTQDLAADPGLLLSLELSDGSVLVTSAERLRESLARAHPELLDDDGTVDLERLREAASAPSRGFGEAASGLVRRIAGFVLKTADGDPVQRSADAIARELGLDAATRAAGWLATKALMAAIESRLRRPAESTDRTAFLYRLSVGGDARLKLADAPEPLPSDAASSATPAPMLVFVHGTASSTLGSFGDLGQLHAADWRALNDRFPGGILGFEHRTLSESPIDNALALVRALPRRAQVSLVTHSRGGLIGDLLCLDLDDAAIAGYRYPSPEAAQDGQDLAGMLGGLLTQLKDAHDEQRGQLAALRAALAEREITVQRYVRVAAPANGTLLASGNLDVFLSGLLSLIGRVPALAISPAYAAFKRVVLEIASRRTDAHLVPGIEAMLPDSPMARLLTTAQPRGRTRLAVIAGDLDAEHPVARLGVWLTDFLLFDAQPNDLVVNTAAMLAGIARPGDTRVLFERGAGVTHFHYFSNLTSREAMRRWLVSDDDELAEAGFDLLPLPQDMPAALAGAGTRDLSGPGRPVVVVLPGVMGTHLRRADDRIWFDPFDMARGGLRRIAWNQPDVTPDDLFGMFYGDICKTLADTHEVVPFPYDWRQPLDVLGARLATSLKALMGSTPRPIRLLAHSMGGLVVRACVHLEPKLMSELMARDGARLVMLGTPHRGAHSMVENLLGKGDTLRTLVRLDLTQDMQQVLDLIAELRGPLQLLPHPDFVDEFQGQPDGGERLDWQDPATWKTLKGLTRDFWFGDGKVAQPAPQVLAEASWLWTRDREAAARREDPLPAAFAPKTVYVYGVARHTPCGVRVERSGTGAARVRLVSTTRGDGTVTWASGRIAGIGRFYYMPVAHGDLLATSDHFGAVLDLLADGQTRRLDSSPPQVRASDTTDGPLLHDAGPPLLEDGASVQRRLLGGAAGRRLPPRNRAPLQVRVRATDLRQVTTPVLVGHYEQDPIAGPERIVDRELLDGALSERLNLGLYAGAMGSATVVLRVPASATDKARALHGAVVTGLGPYNGDLGPADVQAAVRAGVLRYLLQVVDVLGSGPARVPLTTLLLGYNSSAQMSIESSVEALVRGVIEANARFHEITRLDIRVARLDIAELYLDNAISAAEALRDLEPRLKTVAERRGVRLELAPQLVVDDTARPRLSAGRNDSYWPRLIVTPRVSTGDGADATPALPTDGPQALQFLFLGQRARAEAVAVQTQPGLLQRLVAHSIRDLRWQPGLGRTLFQLVVPHELKESVRQFDRLVLVVDGATANLPWELMLPESATAGAADAGEGDVENLLDASGSGNRPLALRDGLVRQLSTQDSRVVPRGVASRHALVIGDPPLGGFETHYPPPPGQTPRPPQRLPGADLETQAVARLLQSCGYQVKPVIGDDASASNVFGALFERAWRILHISAHGVHRLMHRDGRPRTGVLLEDGLLITANEIRQMEQPPELVFLNCCHLGQVDADAPAGRDANLLAASIAMELMRIGVRCVVVAGWAVNDRLARVFGETFYRALLGQGLTFGGALRLARRATYREGPNDVTWGAFQAYGDPGWLAEPRTLRAAGGDGETQFVTPHQLLDDLARRRTEATRRASLLGGRSAAREQRAEARAIRDMLRTRCPTAWQKLPAVRSALAGLWYDLDDFEEAIGAYRAAIACEDLKGTVPIRDIEQLANVEARHAERQADEATTLAQIDAAEAGVRLALTRLERLDLILAPLDEAPDDALPSSTSERQSLRGSALKRLAVVHARRLALLPPTDTEARETTLTAMRQALRRAEEAYDHAARLGRDDARAYPTLNRLSLLALRRPTRAERAAALALADECVTGADRSFLEHGNAWDAATVAAAHMVQALLQGDLGRAGPSGEAALRDLVRIHREQLRRVVVSRRQLDSIATHIDLLADLSAALAPATGTAPRAPEGPELSRRLRALGEAVRQGFPG